MRGKIDAKFTTVEYNRDTICERFDQVIEIFDKKSESNEVGHSTLWINTQIKEALHPKMYFSAKFLLYEFGLIDIIVVIVLVYSSGY